MHKSVFNKYEKKNIKLYFLNKRMCVNSNVKRYRMCTQKIFRINSKVEIFFVSLLAGHKICSTFFLRQTKYRCLLYHLCSMEFKGKVSHYYDCFSFFYQEFLKAY